MVDELNTKEEFTEEEVAKGMLETATGKRAISISGLGDLYLKYPTRGDELDADTERSKAFTRFLMEDGLKTEDEMMKFANERGLWTEEDEERLDKNREESIDTQLKLQEATKGTEKKKLRAKLIELRNEFFRLHAKRNSIFGHTVESKAQNVWWQYLTFRCAYKDSDCKERYWRSWNDFLDELERGPTTELIAEFIAFYNGVDDNFFALWLGEETEQPTSGEQDGE